MGKPVPMKIGTSRCTSGRVPREVKHFSTWWKIKQCRASDDISLVVASEKEIAQIQHLFCYIKQSIVIKYYLILLILCVACVAK